MINLTVHPIHFVNGEVKAELPGLLASAAPRKCTRSRQGDQLLILLTLAGNAPLTADGLKQLLGRMSTAYFDYTGSVTSALRSAADTANQYLMERNMRNSSSGRQSTGLANLAAVHAGSLYLAHAGPVYTAVMRNGEKTVYHDPSGSGKGLGLTRPAAVRYYQAAAEAPFSLLVSADPAALTLPQEGSLTPSELLAGLAGRQASFEAVLVTAFEGSGKVTVESGPAGAEPAAGSVSESSIATASLPETVLEPPPGPEAPQPAAEARHAAQEPQDSAPASASPAETGLPIPTPMPAPAHPASRPAREAPVRPAPPPLSRPEPEPASADHTSQEAVLNAVAKTVDTTRRVREKSSRSLAVFLSRLLPGESGQPASLSPLTMAFVAVAVPVMVVAAALMVYFEKGRGEQYLTYYEQARQAASLAAGQNDPGMLRSAWSQVLYYLDKAEEARPEQSDAYTLRQQAQLALDTLDSITRLDYQPAVLGGLAPEVNITAMVTSSSDLYLLNGAKGRILRGILTGRGYEMDPNFTCDPGPYGSTIVGDLIDMSAMPRGNEFDASLIAVDASGNVLFCLAGDSPISKPLGQPDNNWGKITAITYQDGILYVLDPPNNAVWMFTEGLSSRPVNYFSSNPPPMADAVDLEVNGEDLYLLHTDGHTTTCITKYVGGYDTSCTDPAPYTDPRPGRDRAPVRLEDASFTQMHYLPPPDPSLYYLDTNSGAVYHFSLRLNLNRQLRAYAPPNNPFPAARATAFAVGSNRMAYVAFGNQVFYALIQ